MPINFDFNLAPDEAIDYLKKKGYKLSFNYYEIMHSAHQTAFTVAKVTKVELLNDIHEELIKTMKDGRTFKEFQEGLIPKLQKQGWWGETEVTNPKTGEKKTILVDGNRLNTIFETNTRVAYNVARYEQMQNLPKVFEYWRYVSALLETSRASHRSKHGTILPKDSEWWATNYPPNAWRCKCKVQAYTKSQVEKRGWSVHDGKLENIADKDWAYNVGKIDPLDKVFKEKIDKIKLPDLKALALADYEELIKKEMPKEFKNLTSEERRFITAWVDNSSEIIQAVILKNFNNLTEEELKYKDKAKTLLEMFDKYKSSYPKNLPIHRGLSFDDKKLFELVKLRFKKYFDSNQELALDKKPISFSKTKDIAQEFANGKYSVILTIQKRKTNDLDLERIGQSSREKEIIVKHKLKYKVIDYKEKGDLFEVALEEI